MPVRVCIYSVVPKLLSSEHNSQPHHHPSTITSRTIHQNHPKSTQLAQRHTIHQQNYQIPPHFPEKSIPLQKTPANHERGHQYTKWSIRPGADAKPDPDVAATVILYLRYNALPDCKIRQWTDCELNRILHANNHVFLRK